jgi:hypothetical protein
MRLLINHSLNGQELATRAMVRDLQALEDDVRGAMIELGVNIDHVATVRQARRTYEPDPVWAAVGGASRRRRRHHRAPARGPAATSRTRTCGACASSRTSS